MGRGKWLSRCVQLIVSHQQLDVSLVHSSISPGAGRHRREGGFSAIVNQYGFTDDDLYQQKIWPVQFPKAHALYLLVLVLF